MSQAKGLISFLIITIVMVSIARGQPPDGMRPVDSLRAEIVLKRGERAYISRGALDGLTSSWKVTEINEQYTDTTLPLVWIGDDLSRVELPGEYLASLKAGDSVLLVEYVLPAELSGGRAVRIGLCSKPTPLDRPPVSMSDWDYREAIFARVGDFIDTVECEETYATTWFLRPELDRHLSDGRRIDAVIIGDAIKSNSLECGPFSIYCEHFNHAFDSLYCVASNPLKVQSNFPCLCERNRSFFDSPGFWVQPSAGSTSDTQNLPISSGDFNVVSNDDTLIVLIRDNSSESRYADTVELRIYENYDATRLAFELGEVDIVELAPFDVARYQDTYYVGVEPIAGAVFLSVNNEKPYMQDNFFAASIQYMLNRESLCRVPLGGAVEPLTQVPGADEYGLESPYDFDPRKGRRLLRQIEDLPKFLSLVLTDPGDPGLERVAEYLRGILAREGITLTIYKLSDLELESDESGEPIFSFDLMLSRLFDPMGNRSMILFQSVYHPEFDRSEYNRSLYHSPEMQDQLSVFLGDCIGDSNDGGTAEKAFIYEHLNAPTGIWLYVPNRFFATSAKVISLSYLEGGILNLGRIEIDSR